MAVPLPGQTETTAPSPPAQPGPAQHTPRQTLETQDAKAQEEGAAQSRGWGWLEPGPPQRPEGTPLALLTSLQVLVRVLLVQRQAAGPLLGPVGAIAGCGYHGEPRILGQGPGQCYSHGGAGARPPQGPPGP